MAQEPLTSQNFDQFIKQIELKKDTDVEQAFTDLLQHEADISTIPIEKQLVFYRLKAELFVEQGRYQQGKDTATKGLALAKSLSHPSIVSSELLYTRGFAIESLGDYQAARDDYLSGLEIADSIDDKKIVAMGLVNLGALDYLIQKFDRALIMFNDALVIANKLKDDELLGFINAELGILYSLMGQDEKSLNFYSKAKDYYMAAGKIFYAFNTLRNIAANYAIKGDYEKAIELYQQVIDHKDKISNNELISYVYSGMAWAHIKKDDKNPEASYQYMVMAGKYLENSEQIDIPINHALDKGFLFFELERYDEALESIELAKRLFKPYENSEQKIVTTISRLNLLYLTGETHYKLGDFQQAYQAQDEFLKFAMSLPERNNVEEVEDIRMRYESQQADLENKLLEQEQSVQAIKLAETQRKVESRQGFIAVFAIVSLILAWLLIKTVKGQNKLLNASRTDALTGVANRRRLMEFIEHAFKLATSQHAPMSLVMIDVDNFKMINDKFGHKVGDSVLTQIAKMGQSLMRSTDVFGRFGGEEFIAVLPKTSREDAYAVAERIRTKIKEENWSLTDLDSVSLSLGVVTYENENFEDCQQLIKQADTLLYQAKSSGKDRVLSD